MDRKSPKKSIECFHVTSSKSNFYTIHSRKLLLSYFLEFHKLSLYPKVWADMEILSFPKPNYQNPIPGMGLLGNDWGAIVIIGWLPKWAPFLSLCISSFRALTLWFINLTVSTFHIQSTLLSLCQFFSREYSKPAIFV